MNTEKPVAFAALNLKLFGGKNHHSGTNATNTLDLAFSLSQNNGAGEKCRKNSILQIKATIVTILGVADQRP